MSKSIFVFGSNEAGRHGRGAAFTAYKNHGARHGYSYGHVGDSFAIPTKDKNLNVLSELDIQRYVDGFIAYARGHRDLTFMVTKVGCGLSRIPEAVMAQMFEKAPSNCEFDQSWESFLGAGRTYWGKFGR